MMNAGRVRLFAVFVALLCTFAANNSEGSRKLAQRFVDDGVSCDDKDIHEDKAKQVLSCSSKEMKDRAEAAKNSYSGSSHSTLSRYGGLESDSTLSVKRFKTSGIAHPPDNKETLREERFVQLILSAKKEIWLRKYRNLLSGWATVPRRYLRRRGRRKSNPMPPPESLSDDLIASAAPPDDALSPSQILEPPSPSPSPSLQPPTKAPEPSPPQPHATPPTPSNTNYPSNTSENYSPIPTGNDNGSSTKYIIAGVVSSVVVVLALLILCLVLCLKKKKRKIEPHYGQRDENPLLNFTASDVSAVSSQKSQSINNAGAKSFKGSSTLTNSSAAIHDSSKAESQSSEAVAASSDTPSSNLPLPPGKTAPPPPPGPPPPQAKPHAPAPPPPPKSRRPPPNPQKPSPLGTHQRNSSAGETSETSDDSEAPKTKLKPFFWDKVLANPDQSMVWHEIKAGSFQFNEEMMQSLFGYVAVDKNKNENKKDSPSFETPQFIQIIDARKSQNLAILLKALNVTPEEVCDALKEGNELPPELIQTLLKMAPTSEEELKLRLYSGDMTHLGPVERFLKVMVDIPFAFRRLEALLLISTYQEEVSSIKESLGTLEVACKELRNSRLFLKLLEAVLKTGNRMNDGTYRGGAQAFKLETLLKLSDVKGTDGKTTLLHFVVQEIIRSEGLRAARRLRESRSISSVKTEDLIDEASNETEEYHRNLGLQVVSGLGNELENVRRAALVDSENLSASVAKLGQSLISTKGFLETEMKKVEGASEFCETLASFIQHAESDITGLLEEEKRIMALLKSTGDYFQGRAGKDEGARLFIIIRDFLLMLEKACKDVQNSTKLPSKNPKKETLAASPSQESLHESLPDYRQRLFPAIKERQMDNDFSSDDES